MWMPAIWSLIIHLLVSIGVITLLFRLPYVGRSVRRTVLIGVTLLALVNGGLSFLASLQSNSNQDAVIFVSFCLTPMILLILCIAAFYRLTNHHPDKSLTKWAWLTIIVGLLFVSCQSVGYFAPGSVCNSIHRSQVETVRQALLAYQSDSTRFPLGLQALQPFYIEEMPSLACLGSADHYRLISCENTAVLEMDDFYGEEFHRLFLISGDWETSSDEPRTCGPMGG